MELRLLEQPGKERHRGFDADQDVLAKRTLHARDRRRAVLGPRNELGDDRVVEDRHIEPSRRAAVVTDAGPGRHAQVLDAPWRGEETVVWILRVDAALDGMAVRRQEALRIEREPLTARDPDLPAHEIDAGHHLGDGMFDLQPRVHLEEVVRAVPGQQELNRARIGVTGRARHSGSRRGDRRAQFGADRERRRLLDHLLVSALDRTLAFDERQHRAVMIGEQLHLDVPGVDDASFQVNRRIAKRRAGLGPRRANGAGEIRRARDRPHPLPAAACHGLHQQWIADGPGHAGHVRVGYVGRERLLGAGHDRHTGANSDRARRRLAAHQRHRFRRRADENEAGVANRRGKVFVLRQEAVAGMYAVGARPLRRVDDAVDPEVAVARRARPDEIGLVRVAHVQRRAVALGVHRDRRDLHLTAGADNPDGYLAAVGNEDFAQGWIVVTANECSTTTYGGSGSERDVPVLPGRIAIALVLEIPERRDQLPPGVSRTDHLVDESA